MADLSKLSDAELEAIASGNITSLSNETLQMLAGAPSSEGYAVEALRKGPASSAGLVAGLGALIGESAFGRGGVPELVTALRAPRQPIAPQRPPGQVFTVFAVWGLWGKPLCAPPNKRLSARALKRVVLQVKPPEGNLGLKVRVALLAGCWAAGVQRLVLGVL